VSHMDIGDALTTRLHHQATSTSVAGPLGAPPPTGPAHTAASALPASALARALMPPPAARLRPPRVHVPAASALLPHGSSVADTPTGFGEIRDVRMAEAEAWPCTDNTRCSETGDTAAPAPVRRPSTGVEAPPAALAAAGPAAAGTQLGRSSSLWAMPPPQHHQRSRSAVDAASAATAFGGVANTSTHAPQAFLPFRPPPHLTISSLFPSLPGGAEAEAHGDSCVASVPEHAS
jgi:hypothetical protein